MQVLPHSFGCQSCASKEWQVFEEWNLPHSLSNRSLGAVRILPELSYVLSALSTFSHSQLVYQVLKANQFGKVVRFSFSGLGKANPNPAKASSKRMAKMASTAPASYASSVLLLVKLGPRSQLNGREQTVSIAQDHLCHLILEVFTLPKFMLQHVAVLNGMDSISWSSKDKGIGHTQSLEKPLNRMASQ